MIRDTNGHCSLQMGRYSSSRGQDGFTIRVSDEDSGCVVFEVELSCADMLRAITGMHMSDLPCVYGALDKVGLKAERKTELVPLGTDWRSLYDDFKTALDKAITPFEVDGWIAWRDKSFNGHRYDTNGLYSVSFTRWVPKDTDSSD